MGQHLIKSILLGVLCVFASSCVLKQPSESLGDPVSADEIQAALDEAQTVDQSKAFHVGDSGTRQNIDTVYNSSAINFTYQYKVTEITTEKITYTRLTMETGEMGIGEIPVIKPTPLSKLFKKAQKLIATFKRIINKIQIQTSTAIGQEKAAPKSEMQKVNTTAISSLTGLKTISTKSDDYTSKYYGLIVTHHIYKTENCSQLPNCNVNATRIEFNEIQTYNSGKVFTLKNSFELSKEVPGLFTVLEACLATIYVEGDSQLPYTNCSKVRGFKFGSAGN